MTGGTAPASAVTERRFPRVSIPIPHGVGLTFTADEVGGDRQFDGVIIREGVFTPGLGNPEGDRIWFGRDFISRLAATGEGKKIDLDHSPALEDEVGVMQQLRMDADGERLRATLVLQRKRPRYMDAIGFVEGRLQAKQVPNLSIEITNLVMRPAKDAGEKAKWDFAIIDATLEGVAILAAGACSDKDGCGIGLAAKQAGFTVLALQGVDTKETTTHMCDQKELVASLQADKKALEDRLSKETAALTAAKNDIAAVTTARDSLKAAADQREKEDREDLTNALKEALPTGTDIEGIVGKEPTVASLAVALKAIQHAPKPPAAPAKVGLGRATQPGRPAASPPADRAARVLALRAKVGLPEKSNLPASMQRNTDALLATAAEAATTE